MYTCASTTFTHTHSSLHSSHLIPVITAYLTDESVELQELAANSDRLISSLVEYLQYGPDENDDLM